MIHRIHRSIELPISLEEAWRFFSDPHNLEEITPKELGLKITSDTPHETYAGQIITYTVTPIVGIPMTWVTEITHLRKPEFFVDEQRIGPYRLWHHQHRFSETPSGTTVEDIVDYVLPFGPVGEFVHSILIREKLKRIFDHREEVLRRRFPSPGGSR